MKGVLSYFRPNLSFQHFHWLDPLPKGWLNPWRANVLTVGLHIPHDKLECFLLTGRFYLSTGQLGNTTGIRANKHHGVRYSQPGYGWNQSMLIFRVIKMKLQEGVWLFSSTSYILPIRSKSSILYYNLPSLNLYFQRWGASWKEKSSKEWRRRENGPNDLQTRKQIPEQREWTLMLFQKVWWQ